jgi:putative membrane protein
MPPGVSWTSVHLDVLAAVAAAAGVYAWAWRRRRARVARARALAFGGALAAVVVALNGPLHDLAERYLFTAHMVQHLLLTLVMPPLLLAGLPDWMVDGLLGAVWRRPGVARTVRGLTRPVPALGLYTVALAAWHLPGPYDAALQSHAWHIVEHVTLMATAVLAWWPVVSSSALAPALPYGAQILYLFVFGMPMTVVAALVTGADEVLYGFYAAAPRVTALSALDDQRLGGVIMWVPAGLVPLLAFTMVFFRWVAAEAEEFSSP